LLVSIIIVIITGSLLRSLLFNRVQDSLEKLGMAQRRNSGFSVNWHFVKKLASRSKIAKALFKELLAFDGFIVGGDKNFRSEFVRSMGE